MFLSSRRSLLDLQAQNGLRGNTSGRFSAPHLAEARRLVGGKSGCFGQRPGEGTRCLRSAVHPAKKSKPVRRIRQKKQNQFPSTANHPSGCAWARIATTTGNSGACTSNW